ncbi:lysozyme inhibitor LprI family protein [Novosphingobium sp. 1949]|uniref:Lysozyme inhibitor LprI family protein n=1 Tax=Novosphingobium organovorum TaxID=2930092 RepID=A0ABT0B9Z5_9SPHN|nr:lysozyme inhibitor LprI family protein [Novosphingobium organovorum]MCJ2181843.1 lysozyme inhibitor LprI family protein [Novosphingobium organovorum]
MMTKGLIVAAMGLVGSAGLAGFMGSGALHAQDWQEIEKHYTPAYTKCLDGPAAASGDQSALAQCSLDEVTRQEARIDAALAKAPADKVEALRAGQSKWKEDRGTLCEEEAKSLVGEATKRMARADCSLDETIRRLITIEAVK